MHLVQIPPDALEPMWPLVVPYLQRAVDYSEGTTTLKETVSDIAAKRKQLWVIIDEEKQPKAAAVSMLQKFESGLILATIVLLGGESGHLFDILELRSEFETWARTEGCNRVKIYLRKGWVKKLPEYKLSAFVMSKDI